MIDGYVRDGDLWTVAGQQLKAIATPGHTDSHIAYLIDEKRLLTGDALLIRGCGRTDFQNGSPEVLYKTVTEKLFTLPDDTLVYPCHDYLGRTVSSIGEEKHWKQGVLSSPSFYWGAIRRGEICAGFLSYGGRG